MIFTEAGVQNPVALIFDTPMLADHFLKVGHPLLFAAEVVASFFFELLSRRYDCGVGFNHDQTYKTSPALADFQMKGDQVRVAQEGASRFRMGDPNSCAESKIAFFGCSNECDRPTGSLHASPVLDPERRG